MLKLLELKLSGIGRFVDEQVVDFSTLKNLVQVDGKNQNTGGSSGAGKSTIFNSLDFLLGLNDVPNGVLQSRLTKEAMSVTGVFEWDGKKVTITRGKKLSVDIDGETIVGSNKLAEEKICEILGMSRDLFRKMLHKRQKEGGFFLQFTPKETHEFLTNALGLSDIKVKNDLIENKVRAITQEIATADIALAAATSGYTSNQNALSAIGAPPAKEIDQDTVLALKASLDQMNVNTKTAYDNVVTANNALVAARALHAQERSNLEASRPKTSVAPFDTSAMDKLAQEFNSKAIRIQEIQQIENDRVRQVQSSLNSINIDVINANNAIATGAKAFSELTALVFEIKKVQAAICPTCEQSWITDQAKARETTLIEKAKSLGEVVAAGRASEAKIQELKVKQEELKLGMIPQNSPELGVLAKEMGDLQGQIQAEKMKQSEHIGKQNSTNAAIMAEFVASQQALDKKQREGLAEEEAKLNLLRSAHDLEKSRVNLAEAAFNQAVQKMQSYANDLARYESILKNLREAESKYSEQIKEVAAKLFTITSELSFAEEAKKVIKSYLSCSFDDALEQVGNTATQIIRNIPTMANATIQLEGVRETKDGKIKEEVNAVISMDGEIGIPIKSLSGGERSSVDLAVDLAVIDLLENKTNKGIDVFVLDEPFTGLDTIGIEMALEVLKNSSLNKRLVIVDHNPEVKQMVESKLVVVREGALSRITQE